MARSFCIQSVNQRCLQLSDWASAPSTPRKQGRRGERQQAQAWPPASSALPAAVGCTFQRPFVSAAFSFLPENGWQSPWQEPTGQGAASGAASGPISGELMGAGGMGDISTLI